MATVNTLQKLGFLINENKSVLVPITVCKFLNFLLDCDQKILKLTEKKKQALISLLESFLKIESCNIVKFAQMLGKLVAVCPAIEYGWLYTKLMESEKLHYRESSSMNFNAKMKISGKVKSEMEWWITNIPIGYEKFKVDFYKKEIYTDASDSGWGATDDYNTYGFWNAEEKKWHINYKELFAIKTALEYLAKDLRNCCILLRIDNTTAISYINKMGGVRFKKFNKLAREIWHWAGSRKMLLRDSYIPSTENRDADRLSRLLNKDSE